jgi:chitinase
MQTNGPGSPFSGIGQGSWEQGVYDYRALPRPNSQVQYDEQAKASWCYDANKREMVSFDDEQAGCWKGEYIKAKDLGGCMFWELSGDKGGTREGREGGEGKEEIPGRSLVQVVNEAMGGLRKYDANWLEYNHSRYPNMRDGMPL